jgi:uncharacterized protein (DUF1778 family)
LSSRISSRVVPSATTRQRLRLAAREERRAVRARAAADLGGDRADLLLRAAVRALLVDGDALADDVFSSLSNASCALPRYSA